jgi:4-alpha-glucanotransferase
MIKRRSSGVLLPIASLPSAFGIGDLGPGAYRTVDMFHRSRQGLWQVLPLGPTSLVLGSSPYSTRSAFAGNPALISPESLAEDGWLTQSDLDGAPAFSSERVDYPAVMEYKARLLERAFQKFRAGQKPSGFDHFCFQNRKWLDDYALFVAVRGQFPVMDWSGWPSDVRDRQNLEEWSAKLRDEVEREKFVQYLFFEQWDRLKAYCRRKRIQLIGDFPLYVDHDSADVWVNPEIFQLGTDKRPAAMGGVPPDYFSSTGQLWGNPLYRWDVLKEKDYSWWVERVSHNLRLFDFVRLDHFKGFAEYWAVPGGEKTAVNGRWEKGPGADLFNALLRYLPTLPLIAEDLGVITPDVVQLRDRFDLPGMRVLQFAFGGDPLSNDYKPFSYIPNCVAYTGTHDNDTLLGWFSGRDDYSTRTPEDIGRERENALAYLGLKGTRYEEIHWEFIRLLMMSSANMVIVPMQDILGLGNEARLNFPGKGQGNWEWRFSPGQWTCSLEEKLANMSQTYGRAS